MLCQPTHWRSEMPWMLLFEFWTNTCVPRVDLCYPLKNLKEVKLWSTTWPILVTPASRLLGVWRLLERYSRVSFPPGGSLTNFPCVLVTGRDHVRHMHPGRPVHARLSEFGCRGSSIWMGYTCWQVGPFEHRWNSCYWRTAHVFTSHHAMSRPAPVMAINSTTCRSTNGSAKDVRGSSEVGNKWDTTRRQRVQDRC